jgi:hypothetical protein
VGVRRITVESGAATKGGDVEWSYFRFVHNRLIKLSRLVKYFFPVSIKPKM